MERIEHSKLRHVTEKMVSEMSCDDMLQVCIENYNECIKNAKTLAGYINILVEQSLVDAVTGEINAQQTAGIGEYSRDYYQGYTRAIKDASAIFEDLELTLQSYKKRLDSKIVKEALKIWLDNRLIYADRRFEGRCFMRWNKEKKKLEYVYGTRGAAML